MTLSVKKAKEIFENPGTGQSSEIWCRARGYLERDSQVAAVVETVREIIKDWDDPHGMLTQGEMCERLMRVISKLDELEKKP